LYTLGITHYRAGRPDRAIELFNQSIDHEPNWTGVACNWSGLALAHQRQGNASKARRWLAKGTAWLEQNDPRKSGRQVAGVSGLFTQDWAGAHVLRHEAGRLLKGK
jgi:hypothetical protein